MGSNRDLSANLEVVLDISHAYDLDVEDINELLLFRAALVPKTWVDSYEDTMGKTATEVAECLDDMLDEKAKVDGGLRKGKKTKIQTSKRKQQKTHLGSETKTKTRATQERKSEKEAVNAKYKVILH